MQDCRLLAVLGMHPFGRPVCGTQLRCRAASTDHVLVVRCRSLKENLMRDRPTQTRVISAPDKLSLELEGLLRAKARRLRLSKNETLYVRGSSPESIFCVESGAIQLSATSLNGREAVLNVVEPGRWFGELTVLIEEPRAHDAKALLSTDLLVVPAARLHEIVDNKPAYLLEFLRLVCHRYKWAMERIDAAILQPLSVRLAHRLLAAQATSSVEKATGHPELRLSQEGLGQMLGASRQSVNKQLKEWESEGVLRVAYGRIILLDLDALRRLS